MEFQFTKHALKQSNDRGISQDEIKDAILSCKWVTVEHGRSSAKLVFKYNKSWEGVFYKQKEVKVIFTKENDKIIVITAIARYFKD